MYDTQFTEVVFQCTQLTPKTAYETGYENGRLTGLVTSYAETAL
jgi:hypothetical protein